MSGIMLNRKLDLGASDDGMSGFLARLEYRCLASSRLCSHCGWMNDDLRLPDREWRCMRRGVLSERDHNAARNLERWPDLSFQATGRGNRI